MMLRCVLTLVLAVSSISFVHAQSTIFTTYGSFIANVESSVTEDFIGEGGYFQTGLEFNVGPFTFTANAAGGDPGADTIRMDGLIITTNFPDQDLLFSFTSGNPTAIGGIFLITDVDNNPLISDLTITLSDGTTTTFTTSIDGNDFRGFVSPGPTITSLTLSVPAIGVFSAADELTLGFAASIPEPSTIALISTLGAGVGAYWYRRRNKKDVILA
jgi:hypothetical protein